MSDAIFFAPLRVKVIDERTGLMSREWILFFQAMYLRIGGTVALNNEDLQLVGDVNDATDDGSNVRASVAEIEGSVADESPTMSAADIAELQMLVASIPEDASGIIAAPTAKVGLTAVNGSAFTLMSSGAAPALDQAIAPTMTAKWIFTAAGAAVVIQNDTGLLQFRNTANVEVAQAGTVKSWVGAGSVTDFALGSLGSINFYANSSVNAAFSFSSTAITLGNTTDNPTTKVVGQIGFNNTAPIAKPTATGSRAANAALASLLTALANYGLITDSTTV